MSTERSLVLLLILVVALLSLLKVEKLVRMSFWSYLLLAWSLALGTGILQGASLLQGIPDETFLGLRCAKIAEFIVNAQPTILLIFFVAGLRFFIQYGHLSIKIFSEIFEKKLQTLLRCVLSFWNLISCFYFSLAYFKGDLYERIFMQPMVVPYVARIPMIGCISAIISLVATSQINLRFSFKKDAWTV